jgi:hypothetical protein
MAPRRPRLGLETVLRRPESEKDLDIIFLHGEDAWPYTSGQQYPHPFIPSERLDLLHCLWPRWLCDERPLQRADLSLFCYSGVSSSELYSKESLDNWIQGIAENMLHSLAMIVPSHGAV